MGDAQAVRVGPIRSRADLLAAWSVVLTRSQIRTLSLWAMFIAPDGRVAAPIEVVGELPRYADETVADLYASVCRHELDASPAGWSASLVVVRPGGARVGSRDRAWLTTMADASYRWGMVHWPVCGLVGMRLFEA